MCGEVFKNNSVCQLLARSDCLSKIGTCWWHILQRLIVNQSIFVTEKSEVIIGSPIRNDLNNDSGILRVLGYLMTLFERTNWIHFRPCHFADTIPMATNDIIHIGGTDYGFPRLVSPQSWPPSPLAIRLWYFIAIDQSVRAPLQQLGGRLLMVNVSDEPQIKVFLDSAHQWFFKNHGR